MNVMRNLFHFFIFLYNNTFFSFYIYSPKTGVFYFIRADINFTILLLRHNYRMTFAYIIFIVCPFLCLSWFDNFNKYYNIGWFSNSSKASLSTMTLLMLLIEKVSFWLYTTPLKVRRKPDLRVLSWKIKNKKFSVFPRNRGIYREWEITTRQHMTAAVNHQA